MNIAKVTFTSPVNKENSFTAWSLGEHESTMELHLRDEDNTVGWIEWDIPSADEYVEIGLWFGTDRTTLTDYDGVFALPDQAIKLLRDNGFHVGEEFEAD
jgi:hypothetical protein